MTTTFQSTWWQIDVPPPWKAEDCESCVELTQPEGVGALHISGARKMDGLILGAEALAQLRENCPANIETKMVRCGEFVGYMAEYVDGGEGAYWKKWFVAYRRILLFISYTCTRGDENFELGAVSEVLTSLRCRE